MHFKILNFLFCQTLKVYKCLKYGLVLRICIEHDLCPWNWLKVEYLRERLYQIIANPFQVFQRFHVYKIHKTAGTMWKIMPQQSRVDEWNSYWHTKTAHFRCERHNCMYITVNKLLNTEILQFYACQLCRLSPDSIINLGQLDWVTSCFSLKLTKYLKAVQVCVWRDPVLHMP